MDKKLHFNQLHPYCLEIKKTVLKPSLTTIVRVKNNYSLKSIPFYLVIATLLLLTQTSISQTTYNINDPEALEDQTYVPGDVIILANGVYDSDERIDFIGDGTADDPITFRAESPGGVIFTGGLKMNIGGDFVVVDGFHWKGGYGASNFIQFRNGYDYANHSIMQNCAIDGLGVEPAELAEDLADGQISKHRWIVLYGTYNTIINCSFMNKVSAGALILAEYSYNAFPEVEDGQPEINNSCELVGHTISNNYFYNFEKMDDIYADWGGSALSNAGDCETIRIGTSEYQNVNSAAMVNNNYFVKADGENEIITNKSKNNTYLNNTFRSCRGSLVLRHGSNATVDGNYFLGENIDGTGGIRITDSYHSITNNYIQDCIAVINQAKWNNGITFIGGGDNAAVDCSSTSVSNGYQKTTDINVSNNTIMNTNAPLFYNTDKGSTDPLGNITNNLIYFNSGNANLSDVIMGEYSSLGTALTYTGNVYNETSLGANNTGFSEETGIIATANGEVYTFSGADGKGADMGAYEPTTDAKVGYGIGACFLDYTGTNITNGDCTIEIQESLTVGGLSTLPSEAGSYDVAVNTNVSWTAESNDSWITIDTNSGTGNTTVSVTVTENIEKVSKTGTVTFTQVPGGDNIVRTLTVNQEAADVTSGLILINDGSANDNVVVHSVFHEEITDTKNNIAINSLDKNTGTQWSGNNAADAADITPDTNVGEIIYDLGGSFDLQLVDYMATNGKTYEFQILVSSTTPEDDAFTNPFGSTNLECSTIDSEFTNFLLPSIATGTKYIKIIGYGQPAKPSTWNTIVEIEFYGAAIASTDNDNDGVLNDVDQCPNTPSGEAVDANGCSNGQLDDDNDGVQNSDDKCADTPAGEDVDTDGCGDSQLDTDEDGVMDDVDQCSGTPTGTTVNSIGCFTLSANNFNVETVGESCPNKSNGKIIITATENLNYNVTIDGVLYSFTDVLKVENLAPNSYTFCISIENETYEQCFTANIVAGASIAGKASVKYNKANITISKGTAPFNVIVNGTEIFETMNSTFSVDIAHGDSVQVKTSIDCEGVFLKEIDLFESMTAYPNPTTGRFEIGIPADQNEVIIELYNMQSQLISSKTYAVKYGKVSLNIEGLKTGMYFAKIKLEKPQTIKIIKQ